MPNARFLAPERDPNLKPGRAKGGGTTLYSLPGFISTANSTFTPTINTDHYTAHYTATPILVDQLIFEVTVNVAGNARVGLYVADTDFQPVGAPLADSGDISVATTGVKTYTPGSPVFVPRGRFVTVLNISVSSVSVRSYGGQMISGTSLLTALGGAASATTLTVGRTYAAFPTPGTAWTTTGTAVNTVQAYVILRVSGP